MATVIPPLLPLEAPNDNEQSLWTMIIAMRRALFGLGGPLTIFTGNQGTGGSGGAGGVACEDTNPCSGNPVYQSQGGIPIGDSDTFDRAALCGTANNLGGPWVTFAGGDNSSFCIVQDPTRDAGGALRASGPTLVNTEVVYHNGDWADDQQVSLFFASSAGTLPAPAPQVGLRINPCTLNTGSTNNGVTGYLIKPGNQANNVIIVRYTNGTGSQIFSAGDGSGDTSTILPKDTLIVSIVGATITVQVVKGVNWPLAQQGTTVTRATFTDTAPLTSGRVGFISDLFGVGKNVDIQNWIGTSLGSIISGGACGGGNPNTINPTNAGTVLILTSGGQIGWPCKEALLVDAVNRRIVGSSQPRGNLTLASTCNATKGRVIIQNPDTLRIGAMIQGSVLFAGPNGDVSQDNANFFYDQPNTQLRIPKIAGGTAATSSLNLQSTTGIGTTDFIRFLVGNAGATEAARIIDSGNMGINIIAPTNKLHVLAEGTEVSQIRLEHDLTTSISGIEFFESATQAGFIKMRGSAATGGNFNTMQVWNVQNNAILFGTNNLERVRIDNLGNIGINQQAPTFSLQITNQANGGGVTGLAENLVAGTGNFASWRLNVDGGVAAHFQAYTSTFTANGAQQPSGASLICSGIGGLALAAFHASGVLSFFTGSLTNKRLVIDQNGVILVAGAIAGASVAGDIVMNKLTSLRFLNNAATTALRMLTHNASDQLGLGLDATDIQWGKPLVALGGGAAATLGTIGGTGPATATQNTWARMIDSTGVAFWVPAWK